MNFLNFRPPAVYSPLKEEEKTPIRRRRRSTGRCGEQPPEERRIWRASEKAALLACLLPQSDLLAPFLKFYVPLRNNIQENVENNADMLNDKTWENVAEEL